MYMVRVERPTGKLRNQPARSDYIEKNNKIPEDQLIQIMDALTLLEDLSSTAVTATVLPKNEMTVEVAVVKLAFALSMDVDSKQCVRATMRKRMELAWAGETTHDKARF